MLELLKIAVTGGLSSGKTTFCQILQQLGACYVSADQIVHQILVQDVVAINRLQKVLGNNVFVNGILDRSKVANVVFESEEKLKQVESILHPIVEMTIQKEYMRAQKSGIYSSFIVEVPLLFESNMQDWYDVTVAVVADSVQAANRYDIAHRVGTYAQRMRYQLTPLEKAQRADFVIENNGSIQELQKKARALFYALIQH